MATAGRSSQVKDILSDTRLAAGKGESLQDVAASLVVMDRKWNEVFRQILGKSERSLVNELRTCATPGRTRNPSPATTPTARWIRRAPAVRRFGRAGGRCGQDEDGAAARALRRAGAQRKAQVGQHGHRERRDRQPQALARSGDAACDVASGRYQQAEFAADLWQVHLGEGTTNTGPGGVLPPHLPDRKPEGDAGRRGAAPLHRPRRPGGAVADQLRRRQDALDAGALPPLLGHRADRAGRHRRGDVRRGRQQDSDGPARGAGGQQDFAGQPVDQARRHARAYPVGRAGLAAWRQTGVRAAGRRR
jgi:hypothetical protein